MNKIFLGLLLFLSMCFSSSAQFKGYGYARKINPVDASKYYSVLLDPLTLSRTQSNFNDFRVYLENNTDTTEVPFLFKWQDDMIGSFNSSGKIVDRNYVNGGTQSLTIEFPEVARVNELELMISESNFDKQIKIECSNDNKNWKTIAGSLRIVGVDWFGAYYRSTTVDFNESSFKYFRLTISNVAHSPYKNHMGNIEITGVKSTFNKCFSGSFRKIDNIKTTRKDYRYDPSETNDTVIYRAFNKRPPNPRTKNRITDFSNPLNPTELRIELPYAAYIHHIKIASKDSGDFYRMCDINVFDNYKSFSDEEGKYFAGSRIFSSVTNNIYNIGNSFGKYLVVKIFNYNDAAKKNLEVEIFTQEARLVCQLEKQKSYFIAYGKKNDYKPQYDMEYFQDKLPGAYADVVSGVEIKAHEKEILKPEALIKNKIWLWLVMAVLMVIIGIFALKLIKKQDNT